MNRKRLDLHFHYPWMVFSGVIAFLALFGLFFASMFQTTEADRREYERLTRESNPTLFENAERTPYTATQQRIGLQKDIFFNQGESRLHLRLQSNEAKLVLDHGEAGTELVEHMHGVRCFMQEELYYALPDGRQAILQPDGKLLIKHADAQDAASWVSKEDPGIKSMQIVRYFEAEKASYFYKSDRFYAEDVTVSRYAIPGHVLVNSLAGRKPMMSGKARSVEFSLAGKDLNFKAERMKATFYKEER